MIKVLEKCFQGCLLLLMSTMQLNLKDGISQVRVLCSLEFLSCSYCCIFIFKKKNELERVVIALQLSFLFNFSNKTCSNSENGFRIYYCQSTCCSPNTFVKTKINCDLASKKDKKTFFLNIYSLLFFQYCKWISKKKVIKIIFLPLL